MKHILLFLLLFGSIGCIAQINIQPDTAIVSDSLIVEEEKPNKWREYLVQVYLGPSYEVAPTPEGLNESIGAELGMIYKSHWIAGGYAMIYQGDYSSRVVFPNFFRVEYKHGGFYIGYSTFNKKLFDISIQNKLGFGDMLWQYEFDNEDFIKDNFLLINPTIGIDLNIEGFVKMSFGVGYRHFLGLDLTGVESNEFNGITTSATFKIGRFNKRI